MGDCQIEGTTTTEALACASRIPVQVYTEYQEPPVEVARDVLPAPLKTALDTCDTEETCNIVSYDYTTEIVQTLKSAEYVIDTQNTDSANQGVFVKDGKEIPVVLNEPGGYDYIPIGIKNPNHVIQPPDRAVSSADDCASICNETPNCRAFNYHPLRKFCTLFDQPGEVTTQVAVSDAECNAICQRTDGCLSYEYISSSKICKLHLETFTDAFDYVSYVRQFPQAQTNIPPEPTTWLRNTGSECSDMPACNSNVERLVQTGTTIGFSTDDIKACGSCPSKTLTREPGGTFVYDEVSVRRQFTDVSQLQYTAEENPNSHRYTLNQYAFTVNPYVQHEVGNFFPLNLLFLQAQNGIDFSLYTYQVLQTSPVTCPPAGVRIGADMHGGSTYGPATTYGTNPPPQYNDSNGRCEITPAYSYCVFNASLCTARCPLNYSPSGFTEGGSYNPRTNTLTCIADPVIQTIASPLVLHSMSANLHTIRNSSNTFSIEPVDYVTDGYRIRNRDNERYVSASTDRTLMSWSDKYSPEFNKSIFVLSEQRQFYQDMKDKFPYTDYFLFQDSTGLKYVMDGRGTSTVRLRKLKDIFSVFKMTFQNGCISGISSTQSPPQGTYGDDDTVTITAGVPNVTDTCSVESQKWIVIDIPTEIIPSTVVDSNFDIVVPENQKRNYPKSLSNVFPTSTFGIESRTSDGLSLRQWVQRKYVYTYYSFRLPIQEDCKLYVKINTWKNGTSGYLQNLDTLKQRYPDLFTSFNYQNKFEQIENLVNIVSDNHSIGLQKADAFYRASDETMWTHWNTFMQNYYSTNNSDIKFYVSVLDTYLKFLKGTFQTYKSVISKVYTEMVPYILSALGVDDDDLLREGTGDTETGIAYKVVSMRQKITDAEGVTLTQSEDELITRCREILEIENVDVSDYQKSLVLRNSPNSRIIVPVRGKIEQLYQLFTEIDQLFEDIKRLTYGPVTVTEFQTRRDITVTDLPNRPVNALIQTALREELVRVTYVMNDRSTFDTIKTTVVQNALVDEVVRVTDAMNTRVGVPTSILQGVQELLVNETVRVTDTLWCSGTNQYFLNNQCKTCSTCPTNSTYGSYTVKTPCTATSDTVCELTCPSGSTIVNSVCKCSTGNRFVTLNGTSTCQPCASCPTQTPGYGSTTSSGCGGTDSTDRTCTTTCSTGFTQNASGVCECPAGNRISTTPGTSFYACRPCTAGKYSASVNSTSCTACPAGTYQDETGKTSCKTCAAGSYQDETGKTSCKTCSACPTNPQYGSYSVKTACTATSDTVCELTCPDTSTDVNGVCNCGTGKFFYYIPVQWFFNYIQWDAICTNCRVCPTQTSGYGTTTSSGCDGVSNRTCTTTCSTGFTQNASGVCECPAGNRISTTPGTSTYTCTPCTAGTYSTSVNSTSCTTKTTCAAGKYVSSDGGATSDRTCTDCSAGTYSTSDNSTSCTTKTTCAAGKYVKSEGTATSDRTCEDCAAGTYSNSDNSSSCTACAAGTYQDETGKTSCKTCRTCLPSTEFGRYVSSCSTTGQTSDAICTYACNSGFTQGDCSTSTPYIPSNFKHNQPACLVSTPYCNLNYAIELNSNQCIRGPSCSCKGGSYITSTGTCVQCPSGFISSKNATFCTKAATVSYSCGTNYTLSGTNCVANGKYYFSGYRIWYYCPQTAGVIYSGSITNNCAQGRSIIGCCSYAAQVSYSCPSGSTLNGSVCEYRGTGGGVSFGIGFSIQ